MTPEEKRQLEKQKLKEAYKAELKKRKEFLDNAQRLRTSRKLNDAISQITNSLNDDTDDWIEKLNMEAAVGEAKIDMFLDEATKTTEEIKKMADEAKMAKFKAEDLVIQMKKEMGLLKPENEEEKKLDEALEEENSDEEGDSPKKSLGDI
ncbi:MAG: hypothetical protein AAFY71_27655 [Bacteroidota bacterium]